jgi:DNA repair ATPase RecN
VIPAARQRARRALQRLSLSEAQAETVRRALRDQYRQLEAVREALDDCRRDLARALSRALPDSALVLELSLEERVLEERQQALAAGLERSLVALLRPEQATRLRGLAPAALGDMLVRLSA